MPLTECKLEAYEVQDIHDAVNRMQTQGVTVLGDVKPTIGALNLPVLFLHPKEFCGTMIESFALAKLMAVQDFLVQDFRNRKEVSR